MDKFFSDAMEIRELAKKHNKMFEESIPLIASENVMSPLAMEMLLTDFGHRYAEGLPHQRYYQGNFFVDQLE
ncbi:MAG: serine hydroxymethyltransferase, partial [Cuniculiplasma sp.]|nr:serine hydroxymethyltransferase [Cuniculiplasma sp.]